VFPGITCTGNDNQTQLIEILETQKNQPNTNKQTLVKKQVQNTQPKLNLDKQSSSKSCSSHMCVSISLSTTVVHNTAQNSKIIFLLILQTIITGYS